MRSCASAGLHPWRAGRRKTGRHVFSESFVMPDPKLAPDPARGIFVDRRMRQQLNESLAYIADLLEPGQRNEAALRDFVHRLEQGGTARPSAFGLYYEAAAALLDGESELAEASLAELTREPVANVRKVDVMSLDMVVPAARLQLYQRLMDTDPGTPFRIVSPSIEAVPGQIAAFRSALDRLRVLLPELSGEFDALVREVILVSGAPDLGYDFAGGSCYMLWGALFINAGCHEGDVALIEAIAHESGHSLLFGFTLDEPLVLNDPGKLFRSPLRDDPRPMDGIYHATYVSARMHWAMSRLLASNALTVAEQDEASFRMQAAFRNFMSGHQTIVASARLSETGKVLMDSATAYMAEFMPAS